MSRLESVEVAPTGPANEAMPRRPHPPFRAHAIRSIEGARLDAILYAVTIFLGAFLVFQVQPIIARYVLPWYGGSAAVWTACLLFFQVMLLAGYAYAHLLERFFGRAHAWIHLGLLAATLPLLPVRPDRNLASTAVGGSPTWSILLLLTASIGLPYLALSSTGPLIQSWFRRTHPQRSAYRLYALSNAGSLLALVSYPLLIEPHVTRSGQVTAWSVDYTLFVAASAVCAIRFMRWGAAGGGDGEVRPAGSAASPRPTASRVLSWLGLSACASALLMAITHQLSQDVAAIPFLWVLPLATYLLTLILCFQSERIYDRRLFAPLLVIALGIATYALHEANGLKLGLQILDAVAVLWICCMACHGELVRRRPPPIHLTLFYLAIAAGGAVGGAGVAVVAPAIFDGFWEYHIALAMCFLLPALYAFADLRRSRGRLFTWIAGGAIVLIGGALVSVLAMDVKETRADDVARVRSFYGALRVRRTSSAPLGDALTLFNGRINHGVQFLSKTARFLPTAYYGPESGVGLAIRFHPARDTGPLRVGVVGLGIGTLAAYGRTGDVFRFWEIDPAVEKLARGQFTYLSQSHASIDVVVGDARLRMEEEAAHAGALRYDVLAVDAFSGDAIPTHLLTGECADVYERLLRPNGLLLFHITNHFVDLRPVVSALARHLGRGVSFYSSKGDARAGQSPAVWAVLSPELTAPRAAMPQLAEAGVLWTDEYASLFPLLKLD